MPDAPILHVVDSYRNLRAPYFSGLAARASSDFPTRFTALGEREPFRFEGWTHERPVTPMRGTLRTKFLSSVIPLAIHIRQSRPAIVHAHFFFPTLVALLASRLGGAAFVFTRHHSDHNSRLGKPFHVAIDRWCGRFADRGIAVSDATREFMLSEGIPEKKICVVNNGTDGLPMPTKQSVDTLKAEIGLPPDARIVLMVSRLHEEKGHFTLLDAVASLQDEVPNLWVVLAGDGDARSVIEREIAHRGLRVRVLGRRDDIGRLMVSSDLLALPSRSESFGYVLVEAMGLGLPVVASRCGGIPNVVEDGRSGLLFEVNDSSTLAEHIKQVLANNDLREKLVEGGRRRAGDFSFERMLVGYENVYREVLAPAS